jgi:hypothetical protein
MRRFVRRFFLFLFMLIAACSALICLGSTVLWVRGYFVGDTFKYIRLHQPGSAETWDREYVVASSRGSIGLATTVTKNLTRGKPVRALTWGRDRPPIPIAGPSPTPWGRLGFQFISQTVPLGQDGFIFVIGVIAPSWFVVFMSAMPPGLWYVLWRRRRRTQLRIERGQCVRCGYDLRESPGRCPECGEVSTQSGSVQRERARHQDGARDDSYCRNHRLP